MVGYGAYAHSDIQHYGEKWQRAGAVHREMVLDYTSNFSRLCSFFWAILLFFFIFFSFVAQLSAADCRPEISLFEFRSKGMRGGSICITYCRALCSNRYRRRSYTISHNILLNDTAVVYLRKRTSQHHAREIIMQRIALEIQIHLKSMVFRLCQVWRVKVN